MNREELAADILKELIRCPQYTNRSITEYAEDAVTYANELIKALDALPLPTNTNAEMCGAV